MTKRLVLIESPYAGDRARNIAYAKAAMRDSLDRGEAPFVMHLHFPLVLDDDIPAERATGIEAGLAWGAKADLTAVYLDLGESPGMKLGIARANAEGRPVEYRRLSSWVWPVP
jgi:hypothetical protein